MPRYAFKIAYDGSAFAGFQWQDEQPNVQGVIEGALRRLEPGFERLVAAGRTDSGVHALGQVVHADLSGDWNPFRLSEAMNHFFKPNLVSCLAAARVDNEFSARYSCVQRRYRFNVISRRAPLTVMKGKAWHVKYKLDAEAMNRAAQVFIGLHDFTTFRSSQCQAASPVKTVDAARVYVADGLEGKEIRFEIEARSFMHNQVRSFMGTLERVGKGAWTIEHVKAALAAKDRAACGQVAPPDGLYFIEAVYPEDIFADFNSTAI